MDEEPCPFARFGNVLGKTLVRSSCVDCGFFLPSLQDATNT